MHNRLTLLIPKLLHAPGSLQNLPQQEIPPFKRLNRFFSRTKRTSFPCTTYYETLFHLFGLEPGDHAVAAITRLADGAIRDADWYLRCDPAYIHADMDRAVLLGHADLNLTENESEQLRLIINTHVEQDGWQIEAHAIDRWYVKGAEQTNIQTSPPHDVFGKDIRHDLPRGEHAAYWCSIMNECQMLLHELPVNIERQSKGLLPINSLWFWGEGHLPETAHCQFDAVYGDDALLTGLAMLSNCPNHMGEQIWQAIDERDQQHLFCLIDSLHLPMVSSDIFAWLDAVSHFEEEVLQKLIQSLKNKRLDEINILTGDGRAFQLTRGLLRRWWKSGSKFQQLLDEGTI